MNGVMSDDPENLVLIYLRRIDIKLDRIADDVGDLKVRMTNVDEGLAGVNRRLDRLEARVDRIERRLDLVEG
jgi:archaellum component FlaC